MTTTDTLASLRAVYAGGAAEPWTIDYNGINGHIHRVGPISGYDGDSLDISGASARKTVAAVIMAAPGLALAEAALAVRESRPHRFANSNVMAEALYRLDKAFDVWMAAAAKAVPK